MHGVRVAAAGPVQLLLSIAPPPSQIRGIQACSLIKAGNRLPPLAPAILPIWPNRLRPGAPIGPRWFLAGRGVSPPAHTGGVTHRFFIARFPRVDARFCIALLEHHLDAHRAQRRSRIIARFEIKRGKYPKKPRRFCLVAICKTTRSFGVYAPIGTVIGGN